MTTIEPQLLWDPEAEASLVGEILVNAAGVLEDALVAALGRDDFHDQRLGQWWQIATDLFRAGQDVTPEAVAVAEGGPDADPDPLVNLTIPVIHTRGASAHARTIRDFSIRRGIHRAGSEVAQLAFSHDCSDPDELLSKARGVVERTAREHESLSGYPFRTAQQIAALRERGDVGEAPQLVDGLLVAEGLNLLAGDTSSGKTYLAFAAALGVAAGKPTVWGHRVLKTGPVLVFAKDTPATMRADRLLNLCKGLELEPPANLHVAWGDPDDDLALTTPDGIWRLQSWIRDLKPELVVIDDLTTYCPGVDLNDAGEVGGVLTSLRRLTSKTGCAFLVLTLLNKKSGSESGQLLYRIGGSVFLPGKADTAFVATKSGQGANTTRLLTCVKHRMNAELFNASFAIEEQPHGGVTLTFEDASDLACGDGLQVIAASAMAEILRGTPGVGWHRRELEDEAVARGLKASPRTIKDAWRHLEAMADVQVSRAAKPYVYSWRSLQ